MTPHWASPEGAVMGNKEFSMKNKIKLFGIITIAAFIVIAITSCDLFSQFGQVEYTLTVENNTTKSNTSNLKVYIKLGSDTWEGTI